MVFVLHLWYLIILYIFSFLVHDICYIIKQKKFKKGNSEYNFFSKSHPLIYRFNYWWNSDNSVVSMATKLWNDSTSILADNVKEVMCYVNLQIHIIWWWEGSFILFLERWNSSRQPDSREHTWLMQSETWHFLL